MKKIISLLMILALCTAFSIPAMAATQLSGDVTGTKTFSGYKTEIVGDATFKSGASLTFNSQLYVGSPAKIEYGAVVTLNNGMQLGRNVTLEIGGVLTGKIYNQKNSVSEGNIILLPGGTVDVKLDYEDEAKSVADKLQAYGAKIEKISDKCYRVTAHVHLYTEDGTCCGKEALANISRSGSTLSEGSWMIVLGVAGIAVGFFVAMFLFKKKNSTTADGING